MELQYFYEIFESMPRQGPGDTQHTLKALEIAREHLPEQPRILDVGCGSGAQTLVLAKELSASGASIVALDNHQPFLDLLLEQAANEGCEAAIEVCNASMLEIPFADAEFDMIWGEGAISMLGLAGGLRAWKRLLKPGGLMVVSDNLWLRRSDLPEVRAFWQEESPEMLDLKGTEARIQRCGYTVLGHFSLPMEVWEESYYAPLTSILDRLGLKYPNDETFATIVEALEYEMEIFRRANGDYSYEYWVLTPSS